MLHRVASRRIASHRVACVASQRITAHRDASWRIVAHGGTSRRIAARGHCIQCSAMRSYACWFIMHSGCSNIHLGLNTCSGVVNAELSACPRTVTDKCTQMHSDAAVKRCNEMQSAEMHANASKGVEDTSAQSMQMHERLCISAAKCKKIHCLCTRNALEMH